MRIETKLKELAGIPEGFLQSACQQACPSGAIAFGDILDTTSEAHKMRNHARSYMMLGYLNTRPRTTHMVRVSNPNPRLRTPIEDPFGHDGSEHHDEGHKPAEPKAGGGARRS